MNENQVRQIATEIYNTLSRAPHSVQGWSGNPLLPQFANVSNGASGVLSANKTVGQSVNVNPSTNKSNSTPFVMPVPVIYGGSTTTFQGGSAPNGTVVLFLNGITVQLWVRAYDSVAGAPQWFGVDFTSTNASGNAKVLAAIS